MSRPRRFALSAAALLALLLGSGCTPSLQTARTPRDHFAGGNYMAASDGLGRSVQAAEALDRQERVRLANAPTE